MEIKPTYVTFKQSKWLKEKGFDIKVNSLFSEDGFAIRENQDVKNYNSVLNQGFSRPEQWMLVEWLRVNHGIWIDVGYLGDSYNFTIQNKEGWTKKAMGNFNSPQEAYSAAFDYILKELI